MSLEASAGGKKVLVVSNMWPDEAHPSSGIFVKRFVDQVEALGWRCDLAVMRTADGKREKALRYLAFYISSFLKSLIGSYEVTYVHYPSFSAPSVLLSRHLRRFKLIVNVHGSDVLPVTKVQKKMHFFTKKAIRAADCIVVPSEYFASIVRDKYNPETPVHVYPSGGIDPATFHPIEPQKVASLRKELGLNPAVPTVCFAGRITEGKGWDTYLMALSTVLSKGREVNALLIGSGDQDEACTRLIDELGIRGSIVRMGLQPQDRLCELYNIADAFVFPGRRPSESLGLVAVEAMACGTPVIATDFAAQQYYVKDGYNGLKIPVQDAGALAKAILSIQPDGEIYNQMKLGALETARHYSSGETARGLELILTCIAG